MQKPKWGEESEKDKTPWPLAATRLATIIFWQSPHISPAWWWQPISGTSTGTNAAYDYIITFFFKGTENILSTHCDKKTLERTNWFVAVKPRQDKIDAHSISLFVSLIMECSLNRCSTGPVSLNSSKIAFRLVRSLAKVCELTCLKRARAESKKKKNTCWSLEKSISPCWESGARAALRYWLSQSRQHVFTVAVFPSEQPAEHECGRLRAAPTVR